MKSNKFSDFCKQPKIVPRPTFSFQVADLFNKVNLSKCDDENNNNESVTITCTMEYFLVNDILLIFLLWEDKIW